MIAGEHTRLRRVEESDADLLHRWQSQPTVMRWWGDPSPLPSLSQIRRDAAGRLAGDESSLSLIIETLDGAPVGRLDVESIDGRHRSADVMLYVGELGVAGKGIGRDALRAACRYLFDQRGLHRIGLTVLADNARAIHVYEALGFRREGVLRAHLGVDGELVDEIAMSLLAGELRG